MHQSECVLARTYQTGKENKMAPASKAAISNFSVGDRVTAVGFKDCFGIQHEPVDGLIVKSVRLIEGISIDSYYRVEAVNPQPRCKTSMVEGSERFFSHAEPDEPFRWAQEETEYLPGGSR